jgi:AraC-like DNA-binding protein
VWWSEPDTSIEERGYRNPDRPRLGIEALTLAGLRRRLSDRALATPHRLDFHQITLITRGEGSTVIDFRERTCRTGTLLHVKPGQVQLLPRARKQTAPSLDATIVLFTPAFPYNSPSITALLADRFGPSSFDLGKTELRSFDQALNDLAVEYGRCDESELGIEILRHLLTVVLIRTARLTQPGKDDTPRWAETFTLFQHELERSFAVTRRAEDYAFRLGYSLKTLTRVCKAATGHTAKELVDARVSLEAKRLLVHTDLSAAAIGRRLGFIEASNFVKFFARQTAQTPGAFRHAQRNDGVAKE